MGIEEIQKVNALARELMRHRIAQTSDEALLKAEGMLRVNGVSSMTAAITANEPLGKSEQARVFNVSNESFAELNMDVRSLGVRFEALAREIISLKDEMKKVGEGLSDMNRQVMRLSIHQSQQSTPAQAQASVRSESIVVEPRTAAVQASVQQPLAREAPKVEQPRVTATARPVKEEYTPEDVAIEKIFYFGKS